MRVIQRSECFWREFTGICDAGLDSIYDVLMLFTQFRALIPFAVFLYIFLFLLLQALDTKHRCLRAYDR